MADPKDQIPPINEEVTAKNLPPISDGMPTDLRLRDQEEKPPAEEPPAETQEAEEAEQDTSKERETFERAAAGDIPVEDVPPPDTTAETRPRGALSTEYDAVKDTPNSRERAPAVEVEEKPVQLLDATTPDGTRKIKDKNDKWSVLRVENPRMDAGDGFGILLMALLKLFSSDTRAEGLSILNSFFPPKGSDPNDPENDPVIQARNQRIVEWVDDPKNREGSIIEVARNFSKEFNIVNVVNQRSLLRPDLLAEISGDSAEAARKRGILQDIVSEVELYNQTATVKLDPYLHANQMFQESARFTENPVNTKDSAVLGFAQMKLATVNGALRNSPELQRAIGKTSVTEADLKDRDMATRISVNLMGYYTEKYGSQVAALFAYNGGEGAITRVKEQLELTRDPTVEEVMTYYQKDRARVDDNLENNRTTQANWNKAWAVEGYEYVLLAYSPAWPVMEHVENPRFFKSAFDAADAKARMTALGIPLPTQEDAAVALAPAPAATATPTPNKP